MRQSVIAGLVCAVGMEFDAGREVRPLWNGLRRGVRENSRDWGRSGWRCICRKGPALSQAGLARRKSNQTTSSTGKNYGNPRPMRHHRTLFQIADGKLAAFKALCGQFVAKTKRAKALYYGSASTAPGALPRRLPRREGLLAHWTMSARCCRKPCKS